MSWQQDSFRSIVEMAKSGDQSALRVIRRIIHAAADSTPDDQAIQLGEFLLLLARETDRKNSQLN